MHVTDELRTMCVNGTFIFHGHKILMETNRIGLLKDILEIGYIAIRI